MAHKIRNSKTEFELEKTEEKDKKETRRTPSKYAAVFDQKIEFGKDIELFNLMKGKTNNDNKRIISFRSKSREKKMVINK